MRMNRDCGQVSFHPDLSMLNDYAAGALTGAFALPVSVHLEYCSKCRTQVRSLERVGAAMFEALEPSSVSDDALEKLFSRIDASLVAPARSDQVSAVDFPVPSALRDLIPSKGFEAMKWRKVSKGLRASVLQYGDTGREVALHHIKAGARVTQHNHRGNEVTVVLMGSFSDKDGVYREGDFVMRGPGDVHCPTASQYDDCLCLSVLDAPVQLPGLIGMLARPLVRLRPQ